MTTERSSGSIGDGATDHQWQFFHLVVTEKLFGGIDGRLGVQCIKNGLNQQKVYAAFYQGLHLLIVCLCHFIEADAPEAWVVYVRRKGKGFVHGADGTSHKWSAFVLAFGMIGMVFNNGIPCTTCSCEVDFIRQIAHVVIRH